MLGLPNPLLTRLAVATATGVLVGVTAAAGPAVAGMIDQLALQPGVVTGNLNPYLVKRGDSIPWLGVTFTVHPARITKPSAKLLRDGLRRGQTIIIDQRRVQPTFAANTTGLVLNLPEAELYLVNKGKLVREYPVGVSNANWKAPIGRSRVLNMERHPTWYVPKNIQDEMKRNGREVIEKVDPGPWNPLGTRWIGFADGSFGFHGTTSPTSIKRYASHGCVRFLRPHIEDLYDRVFVGMPVRVVYQPVLLAVDRHSVWLSAYPDFYDMGFDYRGAIRALARKANCLQAIDWKAVERALREKDGTVTDVGVPFDITKPIYGASPKPSAKPSAKPSPTPKPSPTMAPTPMPSPTATIGPSPTEAPTAAPPATPAPAETPKPFTWPWQAPPVEPTTTPTP